MHSPNLPLLTVLLPVITLAACGSNGTDEPGQSSNEPSSIFIEQGLLKNDWTLETVRVSDGSYRPLPLNATWRLRFEKDGSVSGDALCNAGVGTWQADDATLSIANWTQTELSCENDVLVPMDTHEFVSRLFNSEMVMPRIDSGRLFLDTGDNHQMVFSGREMRANEKVVSMETLVRSGGGSRASNGNPVFGDLATPYVIYRDAESLNADFALLPPERIPWPALPEIDFSSSVVVGAYLPLDGSISSDVYVRNARTNDKGLEIEVAHFTPNVADEAPNNNCGASTALSAPWTLVRIASVVEPVSFAPMARAYCSGIPTRNP